MRENTQKQEQLVKLKYSNQTKKEISYINAVNAILELQNNDIKVNFSSVSKLAGVSTNYLYNNEKLRNTIEKARGDKIKEITGTYNAKQDIYKIKYEKMKQELAEKNIQIQILNEKNVELLLENEELKNIGIE